MHLYTDDDLAIPTENPFASKGSFIDGLKNFVERDVAPKLRSASESIRAAASNNKGAKNFGSKVVYYVRRTVFAALTILADISSGSADFFASLARKVNPDPHTPQLGDRFSSRPAVPPIPEEQDRDPSVPPTIPDA